MFDMQLEDDVIAKPGYFTIMKTFAEQQSSTTWILLEFSTLGFIGRFEIHFNYWVLIYPVNWNILFWGRWLVNMKFTISGKMFKAKDLPMMVEFFLMFYQDKPIDWLLDYFLAVKVCNPEKDHVCCLWNRMLVLVL